MRAKLTMSPSGKVHHSLWKYGWVAESVAFVVLLQYYPTISIGSILGYFLGQFITPDMDLPGITHNEWKILRLPILGPFIVAYYTFYGGLFSRKHRSFWTHSIIFSTAIRAVYLFWWLYFVIPVLHDWLLQGLVGAFVGLCISDFVHIGADKVLGER